MLQAIELLVASALRCFRSRRSLLFENLALRQQLAVLKRKHPRPRLNVLDKLVWILGGIGRNIVLVGFRPKPGSLLASAIPLKREELLGAHQNLLLVEQPHRQISLPQHRLRRKAKFFELLWQRGRNSKLVCHRSPNSITYLILPLIVIGDGQRIAVLPIAEQELAFVIGAPQFVGPSS